MGPGRCEIGVQFVTSEARTPASICISLLTFNLEDSSAFRNNLDFETNLIMSNLELPQLNVPEVEHRLLSVSHALL